MITCSVIIPFHSNSNLLSAAVSALKNNLDMQDNEIILVDNNAVGSQLGENKVEFEKFCKIITRKENLMYPSAINLGAEYAEGQYLIFCDADTYVGPLFHKRLTQALEKADIGYSSAKLLDINTGAIIDFGITSSYYNFPHPFMGRKVGFALAQKDHTPMAACAACSAIKRNLFYDIGGFDRKLVHSYSDIDLCLRLQARGYKTVCVSDAIAYHRGDSTAGSGMSSNLKEDTKGIFMAKHPDVPVQIKTYLDAACRYFRQNHPLRKEKSEYFVMDCSTIANPELYIDAVIGELELKDIVRYRQPYPQRDSRNLDAMNFIPYQIRNYKTPILYFVDRFSAFQGNQLWKICRNGFDDIVLDRHANIEMLKSI